MSAPPRHPDPEALDALASPLRWRRWGAVVALIQAGPGLAPDALERRACGDDPRAGEAAATVLAAWWPAGAPPSPRLASAAADIAAILARGGADPRVALARVAAAEAFSAAALLDAAQRVQRGAAAQLVEHLGGPLRALAIGTAWLELRQTQGCDPGGVVHEALRWIGVLHAARAEPAAPFAAMRWLPDQGVSPVALGGWLEALERIFGVERLTEPVQREVRLEEIAHRAALMAWLTARGRAEPRAWSHLLGSRVKAERLEAARGIASGGPDALPLAWAALEARQGPTRAAAAAALEQAPHAASIAPLARALGRERSGGAQATMRRALRACEAAAPDDASAPRPDEGPDPAASVSALLEELRAMLYGITPSFHTWIKLCHQIERFRRFGALDVAADYLQGHGIEEWPRRLRPCPWCWLGDARLAALSGRESRQTWVPLEFAFSGGLLRWFHAVIPDLEEDASQRCLDESAVATFDDWLGRAWRWAAREQIPFEDVELRVDGGVAPVFGFVRSKTTIMELQRGWGIVLHRGFCVEGNPRVHGPGLRHVRARIGRDHPLRLTTPALIGQTSLDLLDYLS